MGKFLTIIVPCYNEGANLERGVLEEMAAYLSKKSFSYEVLISDDGSSDNSKVLIQAIIKKYSNFRLLANEHGGKPMALLAGINKATGEYILTTDMDQSTPLSELDKLLPEIKKGFEVVIGSRGVNRKNFPLYRKLGAAVFMSFRKFLILPEIKDTQCGFKLYKTTILKRAFPKLEFIRSKKKAKGWTVTSFDVELLHIIKKMGYQIKEVVVTWNDRDVSVGKGGGLKRYFKESRDMFLQILRVKGNDLKGFYNN
jgi:dolichyl-phosphate beta-glucosyltransferase